MPIAQLINLKKKSDKKTKTRQWVLLITQPNQKWREKTEREECNIIRV
jgi:hypothetical protein